jgi:hypothetical protein
MTIKNFLSASIFSFVLTGCTVNAKLIGEINMISNRNIDHNTEYQLLSRYQGANRNQMMSSRCVNIQDAINQTVKEVPGGEYLMNAKIYLVNNMYYVVEGDVWGIPVTGVTFSGYYKIGDMVSWKAGLNIFKEGKIVAIGNNHKYYVIEDEKGLKYNVKRENILQTQE